MRTGEPAPTTARVLPLSVKPPQLQLQLQTPTATAPSPPTPNQPCANRAGVEKAGKNRGFDYLTTPDPRPKPETNTSARILPTNPQTPPPPTSPLDQSPPSLINKLRPRPITYFLPFLLCSPSNHLPDRSGLFVGPHVHSIKPPWRSSSLLTYQTPGRCAQTQPILQSPQPPVSLPLESPINVARSLIAPTIGSRRNQVIESSCGRDYLPRPTASARRC